MSETHWIIVGGLAILASYIGAIWLGWAAGRSFQRWRTIKEIDEVFASRRPTRWIVSSETETRRAIEEGLRK